MAKTITLKKFVTSISKMFLENLPPIDLKTITRILYCSSIQIDNQTDDGNSVILSPAVLSKAEKDLLLVPGNYDAFISTAVGYFLKHVDLWKIKRAAQEHVNNDKTIRKELDKKRSYEYHLKRRLVKEFCLFVLIEEPWQSESRVIKNTWEIFRGEIQKAKSTDNVEFIVPFEDAIIREIDIHVESTTLFYFALEKVAGINHVIRHVELDTPYFDVEIQEDFIFSVLSSLNSSFNTMDGIASDIDELGS